MMWIGLIHINQMPVFIGYFTTSLKSQALPRETELGQWEDSNNKTL